MRPYREAAFRRSRYRLASFLRSAPTPFHKRHSAHGFALMESTAALFVAAVGLFGVLQMYQYGTQTLRTVQEHTIAGRALQNEVESLRGLPFDQLKPGKRPEHLGLRLEFISTTPETDRLLRAKAWVNIREREEAQGELLQVTASLRWTGEHGRIIKRSVTTLIARKDAP